MNRKAIPEAIKRQVLIEAGYRCGVPTCRNLIVLELHHIIEVSKKGANEAGNLLPLCPTCHSLYTRGHVSSDAVRAWKMVLVSLSQAFDRRAIDDLLFLEKFSRERKDFICTGDGVTRFTQLYAAGLARFQLFHGVRGGVNVDYYRIQVTEKGIRLLEGWLAGDRQIVDEAFEMQAISDQDR
jgi:hypothetical protein